MTRLIDADSLRVRYQAILDRGGMFCEYDIIGMLDTEPTVESNEDLKTKPVVIVDDLGHSIRGYYDPARELVYTGYGIVPSKWLNGKKYKMISQPEEEKKNETR